MGRKQPQPSKNLPHVRIEYDESFEPSDGQCMALAMACMASIVLFGCLLWL